MDAAGQPDHHHVLHASGLGVTETAKMFVGVMSLTWAGSQVTKVLNPPAARPHSLSFAGFFL